MIDTLLAISPLDGRYYEKLPTLRTICSEFGLIKYRLLIEVRWLLTLMEFKIDGLPELSSTEKKELESLYTQFSLENAQQIKSIEAHINHDVKAVEYFIKEYFKKNNKASFIEFIHFACTSEDINNLSYGLMLMHARQECILPSLQYLFEAIQSFAHLYADLPMLARTHGQPASPTTVGKEFANVAARLHRQLEQLKKLEILGKINGASGNYNAHMIAYPEIDWQSLSKHFVESLGLGWNPYTTQIEPHDNLAEFFNIMTRINNILIDFNRDIWAYISIGYFNQKSNEKEVGSSTMPHKINPIDFENSEGNLGLANALFEHMAAKLPISRWQRDLSDSTVLRNIGVAIGHSLLAYQATLKGIKKIQPNIDILAKDLENHWEVLAEAIQTMMRRFNLEEPYEKLKTFTRGKPIDKLTLQQFINELTLPVPVKQALLKLTPHDYIGYAGELAKRI